MEKEVFRRIYENEEGNWWYRSLRSKISVLVEKYAGRPFRILDAGCGTGYGMVFFGKYGSITGVDDSEEALKLCRSRGISDVRRSNLTALDFRDKSFDLILCIDVLCHLDDADVGRAMEEMKRVMTDKGSIVINLPALDILKGAHDRVMGVKKRYTAAELRSLLGSHGFKVRRSSYVFSVLFLPLLVRRLLGRVGLVKGPDLIRLPKALNSVLFALSEIDTFMFRFFDLPIGSSVLCLATKN